MKAFAEHNETHGWNLRRIKLRYSEQRVVIPCRNPIIQVHPLNPLSPEIFERGEKQEQRDHSYCVTKLKDFKRYSRIRFPFSRDDGYD